MGIKVLIVDDQADNLDLLLQTFEDQGMEVFCARDGQEALSRAPQVKPDVIVLDIQMPGMDGYEVCRRLKAIESTRHVPVIFLTASETSEDQLIKGLEAGAYEYLTKPFRERELVARVQVMAKIKKTEDVVREESMRDALTGLFNRRFLERRFAEELSRAKRSRHELSCLMLDIDHFKSVNDIHGHPFGDFVLVEVSRIIQASLRAYDVVARYGGEEILVILPATKYEDALTVAEKIRKSVEKHLFRKDDKKTVVTVSLGVFGAEGEELQGMAEEFIRKADEALYKAKGDGRNRVVGYRTLYDR